MLIIMLVTILDTECPEMGESVVSVRLVVLLMLKVAAVSFSLYFRLAQVDLCEMYAN